MIAARKVHHDGRVNLRACNRKICDRSPDRLSQEPTEMDFDLGQSSQSGEVGMLPPRSARISGA
jgi:hypothetical protein